MKASKRETKTVTVEVSVWERLHNLKVKLRKRTLSDVIKELLDKCTADKL